MMKNQKSGVCSIIIFSILILLVLVPFVANAQITGKWTGYLSFKNKNIELEFDFDKGKNGIMNVPGQGAYGLKINLKEVDSQKVKLVVDSNRSKMHFTGEIINKDSISGSFTQKGYMGRFRISRENDTIPDNPWTDREITFYNDTIKLSGTLSLPDTTNKYPAVIFITGSGQQNRNENIKGFKVFKQLAVPFIKSGIAVLRYDDRGVGGSDNVNYKKADSKDFAEDAEAAFRYLSAHPNIKPDKIGFLGHSEGGLIAPIVAQDHDPAFIIMMAGSTVPGDKLLEVQTRALLKANNLDKKTIESRVKTNSSIYDELKKENPSTEKLLRLFLTILKKRRPQADSSMLYKRAKKQASITDTPWLRFFLKYDPKPVLEKLDIPVLAVFGGKDLQVVDTLNRKPIDRMIENGKSNFTVKVFPEANHLFQDADLGTVDEYGKLPKEFVEGFKSYLTEWARKALKK